MELTSTSTRRGAVMGALALIGFSGFPGLAAHTVNSAEAFVQANIDKSYAILKDGAANAAERELRFRALLLSVVDVERVALFTLGPYGRDAAEAKLEGFIAAFTDLLIAVYERGLDIYTGQSLEVTGSSKRSEDDVIVAVGGRAQSGTPSQPHLAFRVRRASDGRIVITDMQIEGAWLALMQRAEFLAYLQQHGGDITKLSAALKKRASQLRLAGTDAGIES